MQSTILTPEAITFLTDLIRKFAPSITSLLQARHDRQLLFDAGQLPNFLEQTAHIRQSRWTVAPIPPDLQDRRVEITGPTDRKMIINALNSGANVFMADFEDSNSPTYQNIIQGQINLMDAVRRTITYTNETGKQYKLNNKTAVLMVRPRGWHLVEKHFLVDEMPAPASLFDFGLFLFHNAYQLIANGTGPYFYLPKLESHLEARLWNDVFVYTQEQLGIPVGTIRATCLIETITAAFEMDEILWELRDHSAGLNMGRYDYVFSYIKKLSQHADRILPDRSQVVMDKAFLDAYVRLLVRTCHQRGVHAMGGMAAQIPIKNDEAANQAAMDKVRSDKLREVKAFCDGAWISHPGLLSIVKQVFDEHMPQPNQIDRQTNHTITQADLLEPHQGVRTEEGLRHNIRVGIQYLESWLRGAGCVPIYNLMEDAATYQVSFAQTWQWLYHQATVNGEPLTLQRFKRIAGEELKRIEEEIGERYIEGQFQKAFQLFMEASIAPTFQEFFTLTAYDLLGD